MAFQECLVRMLSQRGGEIGFPKLLREMEASAKCTESRRKCIGTEVTERASEVKKNPGSSESGKD